MKIPHRFLGTECAEPGEREICAPHHRNSESDGRRKGNIPACSILLKAAKSRYCPDLKYLWVNIRDCMGLCWTNTPVPSSQMFAGKTPFEELFSTLTRTWRFQTPPKSSQTPKTTVPPPTPAQYHHPQPLSAPLALTQCILDTATFQQNS